MIDVAIRYWRPPLLEFARATQYGRGWRHFPRVAACAGNLKEEETSDQPLEPSLWESYGFEP